MCESGLCVHFRFAILGSHMVFIMQYFGLSFETMVNLRLHYTRNCFGLFMEAKSENTDFQTIIGFYVVFSHFKLNNTTNNKYRINPTNYLFIRN